MVRTYPRPRDRIYLVLALHSTDQKKNHFISILTILKGLVDESPFYHKEMFICGYQVAPIILLSLYQRIHSNSRHTFPKSCMN